MQKFGITATEAVKI